MAVAARYYCCARQSAPTARPGQQLVAAPSRGNRCSPAARTILLAKLKWPGDICRLREKFGVGFGVVGVALKNAAHSAAWAFSASLRVQFSRLAGTKNAACRASLRKPRHNRRITFNHEPPPHLSEARLSRG